MRPPDHNETTPNPLAAKGKRPALVTESQSLQLPRAGRNGPSRRPHLPEQTLTELQTALNIRHSPGNTTLFPQRDEHHETQSSATWTSSSADLLMSEFEDVDDRNQFILEYNRVAKQYGVRLFVPDDFSDPKATLSLSVPDRQGSWFSRVLRSSSLGQISHGAGSNSYHQHLGRRRSISDVAMSFMHHQSRDQFKGQGLPALVRLCGKSLFYLPTEYAPCSLVLPTCFRALAQALVQQSSSRGIFRVPGSIRQVNALYDYYCADGNPGDVSSTTRCPNLPSHIKCGVHDVASAFKRFLAGIPGGILGSLALFDALVAIHSQLQMDPELNKTKTTKLRARLIALAIGSVESRYQRELICAVFGLLCLVGRTAENAPHEDEEGRPLPTGDLMGYNALGIVFGPLLIGDLIDSYCMKVANPSTGLVLFPISPPKSRKEKHKKSKRQSAISVMTTPIDKVHVANEIAEMMITHWREIVRHMRSLGALKANQPAKHIETRRGRNNFVFANPSSLPIRKPPGLNTTALSAWERDFNVSPTSTSPTPASRLRASRSEGASVDVSSNLPIKPRRAHPRNSISMDLLSSRQSTHMLSPTAEENLSDPASMGNLERDKYYSSSGTVRHTPLKDVVFQKGDSGRRLFLHQRNLPHDTSLQQYAPWRDGRVDEKGGLDSAKQRTTISQKGEQKRVLYMNNTESNLDLSNRDTVQHEEPTEKSRTDSPSKKTEAESDTSTKGEASLKDEYLSRLSNHNNMTFAYNPDSTTEDRGEQSSTTGSLLEVPGSLSYTIETPKQSLQHAMDWMSQKTVSSEEISLGLQHGRSSIKEAVTPKDTSQVVRYGIPDVVSQDATPVDRWKALANANRSSTESLAKSLKERRLIRGSSILSSQQSRDSLTKGDPKTDTPGWKRQLKRRQSDARRKTPALSSEDAVLDRFIGSPTAEAPCKAASENLPKSLPSKGVYDSGNTSRSQRSSSRPFRGAVKAMAARFDTAIKQTPTGSSVTLAGRAYSNLEGSNGIISRRNMRGSPSKSLEYPLVPGNMALEKDLSPRGYAIHEDKKGTPQEGVQTSPRRSKLPQTFSRGTMQDTPTKPPRVTLQPPGELTSSRRGPQVPLNGATATRSSEKDRPVNLGTMVPHQEQPPVAHFVRPSSSGSQIARQSNGDLLKTVGSSPLQRGNSVLHSQICGMQRRLDSQKETIAQLRSQVEAKENTDIGTVSEQLRHARRESRMWRERAEAAEKRVRVFERFIARVRDKRGTANEEVMHIPNRVLKSSQESIECIGRKHHHLTPHNRNSSSYPIRAEHQEALQASKCSSFSAKQDVHSEGGWDGTSLDVDEDVFVSHVTVSDPNKNQWDGNKSKAADFWAAAEEMLDLEAKIRNTDQ